MYMADAHTHSHHSPDGFDSMAALCKGALETGLSALYVTDHYDRDGLFDPAEYRTEFEKARASYAGRLAFHLGVELGEGHLTHERSKELINAAPFDFILGSCHYIEGKDDFYELHIDDVARGRRLILDYLDELTRMITWGMFDVLGHFTYPLRYMRGRDGLDVDFQFCEDRVRDVFSALAGSGKGLEVNVSGLRRGEFFMPDLPLLKLYRACGGEIVTVGSDAHHADHVGAYVRDGYELLHAAGFSHASVYRMRQVEFFNIA